MNEKALTAAHWTTRVVASAILAMGAIPKFTGGAGELIDKLPGGAASATLIAVAEVVAIVLMLVPKTAMFGTALAGVIMLGAVGSHVVGPVGMEGDFATMFVMALIALLAAIAGTVIAWKRGYRPPLLAPPTAA